MTKTYTSVMYPQIDRIENKQKKSAANKEYVVSAIVEDGEVYTALFTDQEIDRALKRAAKNPEDLGDIDHLIYDKDLLTENMIAFVMIMNIWDILKLWFIKTWNKDEAMQELRRAYNEEEGPEGDSQAGSNDP